MGFDKDRRPIWMPGRRNKVTTLSSTAVVVPSYGFSIIPASTLAGTKKFKMMKPLGIGTEVNILGTGIITGSSAVKAIVTSSGSFFVTATTKTYRKALFTQAKRGAILQCVQTSTANYFVLKNTTSVSFSTST